MGCGYSYENFSFIENSYYENLDSNTSIDQLQQIRCNGSYESSLAYLSTIGQNFSGLNRSNIPKDLLKTCFICCNTINPFTKENEIGPLFDAIQTAKNCLDFGYKVFYLINPTSSEFLTYLRCFLSKTYNQIFIHFCGFIIFENEINSKYSLNCFDKNIPLFTIFQFIKAYSRKTLKSIFLFEFYSMTNINNYLEDFNLNEIFNHTTFIYLNKIYNNNNLNGLLTFLFWNFIKINPKINLMDFKIQINEKLFLFNNEIEIFSLNFNDILFFD